MNRSEIKRMIVSARKQQIKANARTRLLIEKIEEDFGVRLDDFPCDEKYNANTLEEAVLCHVAYGEADVEKLLDDIMEVKKNVPLV